MANSSTVDVNVQSATDALNAALQKSVTATTAAITLQTEVSVKKTELNADTNAARTMAQPN